MNEIELLVRACRERLDLNSAVEFAEYGYAHLPLCVIDAVWSINVRYEGVRNVITRYCSFAGLSDPWTGVVDVPAFNESGEPEHTITEFIHLTAPHQPTYLADNLFGNRCRTSPRGGILKAQAVCQFADVLHDHGIDRKADVLTYPNLADVEHEIFRIPGQSSGVSLKYFYMLCGANHLIKPDRRIYAFLQSVLGYSPSADEAQRMLGAACDHLIRDYPHLNARLLDNLIWAYQRTLD